MSSEVSVKSDYFLILFLKFKKVHNFKTFAIVLRGSQRKPQQIELFENLWWGKIASKYCFFQYFLSLSIGIGFDALQKNRMMKLAAFLNFNWRIIHRNELHSISILWELLITSRAKFCRIICQKMHIFWIVMLLSTFVLIFILYILVLSHFHFRHICSAYYAQ